MELNEGKNKFIEAWGIFGSEWGINRTMAQIHALLLVSAEPLSTEDIMEELNVSRGNVNMNTRDLIAWGIVSRVLKKGERREFFQADKDIYKVAIKILNERRKRELGPVLEALKDLKQVKGTTLEAKEFKKVVADISSFGESADKMISRMTKADENWFTGSLMKFLIK
ncbi:MAG: transcriptional regulator [Bacteroidetes bacterium]|nr:transcriptional regulator [Bacteroidota bacterium]